MNYILDTLHEFWQYLKPQSNVYLAGIKHNNAYILIRMIPENVALPEGYELLSQPMTKAQASIRINNFKIMRSKAKC